MAPASPGKLIDQRTTVPAGTASASAIFSGDGSRQRRRESGRKRDTLGAGAQSAFLIAAENDRRELCAITYVKRADAVRSV